MKSRASRSVGKKSYLKLGDKERTPNRKEKQTVNELNKLEANKLSDIEFKTMVIRMLKEFRHSYKELSGNYSMKQEIEIVNKNLEEMKNTISELKT